MKKRTGFITFVLLFLAVCLGGCNDEENEPLRFDLSEDSGNTLSIYFPRNESDGSAGSVTILGGDGNYTTYCDNPDVLKLDMKYSNAFVLYPQNWGTANVIATDGAGKSVVLQVNVIKETETYSIALLDVLISDDGNLTDNQKKAIREEARTLSLVKSVGGGYRLVRDDPENANRGTLYLYPNDMEKEEDCVKGSFVYLEEQEENMNWRWIFNIKGKEHRIGYMLYQPTETKSVSSFMIQSVIVALVEDVTSQLSTQYPGVTVYTLQVIHVPR